MITLHRRSDGGFITSISAEADRSWVVNDKGKCTIQLSVTDAKAIRRYMGSRNLICIDHPKLPDWGGVIETDEAWNEDGTIDFTAWSGESLLISRAPTSGLISAGSPGALFVKMINIANTEEDLRIRVGNIYPGGSNAEATLDGTNLFEQIKSLAKRWNMEFSIDPIKNNDGTLSFSANWYARQGVRSSLVLKEGLNIERRGTVYRRQRRIVNKLIGMGDASTASRPTYTAVDVASRDFYGLMEGTEDFDGAISPDTVKQHTLDKLKELRQPRDVYALSALDKGETFNKIRKGNVHPLLATSFGWKSDTEIGKEDDVRVMGIRLIENKNMCELTVEEEIA